MYSPTLFLTFILIFLQKSQTTKVFVVNLRDDGNAQNDILKIKEFQETSGNTDSNEHIKHHTFKHGIPNCLLKKTKKEKIKCFEKLKMERSHKPYYPFYTDYSYTLPQRPKRTVYSLFNYYGGILKSKKPFIDLTRQEFSQDYLDINDLSRSKSKPKCRWLPNAQEPDCDITKKQMRLADFLEPKDNFREMNDRIKSKPKCKGASNKREPDCDITNGQLRDNILVPKYRHAPNKILSGLNSKPKCKGLPNKQEPDCDITQDQLGARFGQMGGNFGQLGVPERRFELQRAFSESESESSSEEKKRECTTRKPNRFQVVFNDDSSNCGEDDKTRIVESDERPKRNPVLESSEESIKHPKTEKVLDSSEESIEQPKAEKVLDSSEESIEQPKAEKVLDSSEESIEQPKAEKVLDSSEESIEQPKAEKVLDSSEESIEQPKVEKVIDSSLASEESTDRQKMKEKYAYLQGNRVYDDFRKRLEHFLPKRYHWDADDIQHLGYYWFDGPRGKYT